jgi:signal transduction histidine kinase
MHSPARQTDATHDAAGVSDAAAARVMARAEFERAALRVAECDTAPTRFAQRSARLALGVIVEAVHDIVESGSDQALAQRAWSPDAAAMLAALRGMVLRAAAEQRMGAEHALQYLSAIETLAVTIDADAAVRFTNQFSGANALTLLVEVAHDMASPLGAIMMLVERLQRGGSGSVSPAQERHLALVYSAAFGLSTMASDMMELARGGARLLDEAPRAFSVGEVLRSVRDLVQPLAEEKRLSVRYSGPPVDRRVGLPAALNRVLLNLTTNAFKFTTVGAVTVLVEQGDDVADLLFSVQDSGRGIPDAELAHIFSAFTQREASHDVVFSSTGMGLAICHKLVSAMGGTLAARSKPGRGTCFSFTLRLPPA